MQLHRLAGLPRVATRSGTGACLRRKMMTFDCIYDSILPPRENFPKVVYVKKEKKRVQDKALRFSSHHHYQVDNHGIRIAGTTPALVTRTSAATRNIPLHL